MNSFQKRNENDAARAEARACPDRSYARRRGVRKACPGRRPSSARTDDRDKVRASLRVVRSLSAWVSNHRATIVTRCMPDDQHSHSEPPGRRLATRNLQPGHHSIHVTCFVPTFHSETFTCRWLVTVRSSHHSTAYMSRTLFPPFVPTTPWLLLTMPSTIVLPPGDGWGAPAGADVAGASCKPHRTRHCRLLRL